MQREAKYLLLLFALAMPAYTAKAYDACEGDSSYEASCTTDLLETTVWSPDLPTGWSYAAGSAGVESSVSSARVCDADSSSAGFCLVIEKSGRPAVTVEADELIPVTAGQAYRLRMNYRMNRNDGDPRGRIKLQAFYYDADGKPIKHWVCSNNSTMACLKDSTCGEGGTCSRRYPVREEISTMYNRKASTFLFTAQTHIAPGTYYDASGVAASQEDPVTKDAAFVQLKFWTNYFFEGEISVEGMSLTPVFDGELGALPEGGLAYDIVANRCDGGDANGQTCSSDADCGKGRCGAATPGFDPLPIGSAVGEERACGFMEGNARMNRGGDACECGGGWRIHAFDHQRGPHVRSQRSNPQKPLQKMVQRAVNSW